MLLLYMGFYGLLHCAEKGKNGFESRPVRHLSNAKIYLRSPKNSKCPRTQGFGKLRKQFGHSAAPYTSMDPLFYSLQLTYLSLNTFRKGLYGSILTR